MEANNKKINRKRKRKLRKIWKHTLSALSCLVVFCTTYALILPAITAETKTYCGKEEHTHTENCYRSDELLCDLEESKETERHQHNDNCYEVKKELICTTPESEEHTHGEECYKEEKILTCTKEESEGEKGHEHSINCYRSEDPLCEKEEHVHDRMCYSNQDLKEKEEDWKRTLPKNLDKLETLNEKLAAIAYSQKGYEEVKENYIEDEETKDLKYYTRYGEWYGKPYEDWNIMFTSFVLRYAGISQTEIPWGQDWDEWVKLLSKKELVLDNTYEPTNGDIVLLKDKEDEKNPDKEINVYSGFIYGKEEEKDKVTYKAIIGDFNDKVEEVLLKDKDYEILGYIHPKDEDKKDEENTEDSTDKDEGNKEENPDEEDQPSEDDLLKPEEPEKIEYQLPEYFLYENEDFTLKLTPKTLGNTINKDNFNSEDLKENSSNTNGLPKKSESDLVDLSEAFEEEAKNVSAPYLKTEVQEEDILIPELNVQVEESEKINVSEDIMDETKEDSSKLTKVFNLTLSFTVEGQELDLFEDSLFDAEFTPSEKLIEEFDITHQIENVAEEAEVGTEVSFIIDPLLGEESSNLLINKESENYQIYNVGKKAEPIVTTLYENEASVEIKTSDNPKFTVQTYAYIDSNKLKENGGNNNSIPVIDQTHNIPKNNVDYSSHRYEVNVNGEIVTEEKLEELFLDTKYNYVTSPNLNYFNQLRTKVNYKLKEIWVLKPGQDKTDKSGSETIWTKYKDLTKTYFTNRKQTYENAIEKNEPCILLTDTSVVRLVFDQTSGLDYSNKATFYDYDITESIKVGNTTYKFTQQNGNPLGINNAVNREGQSGSIYGFGNANTGISSIYNEKYQGRNLNSATPIPGSNRREDKPVFGIVKNGLDAAGNIQFSDEIQGPDIFGTSELTGKSSPYNSDLNFLLTGDTYTLSSVSGGGLSAENLHKFFHPRYNDNNIHNHIWTNDFWPMDNIQSSQDGKTGTARYYRTPVYTKADKWLATETYKYSNSEDSSNEVRTDFYPPSDNAAPHNNMFGMYYEFEFELDDRYTGPLNYFFFGDDDMWVFLDNKLICDIGGVHSSYGAEVDLWEHLGGKPKLTADNEELPDNVTEDDNPSTETHKIKIFFTERGLSGSTCFMQFNIPEIRGANLTQDTGSVKIEKQSENLDPDLEFSFKVNFTAEDGSPLKNDYIYSKYSDKQVIETNNLLIWDNAIINLKAGQSAIIKHLPLGSKVEVTELSTSATIKTYVSSNGGTSFEESTSANGSINLNKKDIYFLFNNIKYFSLPETGGVNRNGKLVSCGISLIVTATLVVCYKKRKVGG